MVMLIDPDTGDEYEETEEDILATDRYYARMAKKRLEEGLPEFKYGRGADGHSYRYNVVGKYPDGTLRTTSFDSVHLDNCPCRYPERWY